MVFVVLLFSPIGRWVFVPGPSKAEIGLDHILGEVRLNGVTLEQALKSIGDQAGVEIFVDRGQLKDYVGRPVVMRLRNVTVRQAIESAVIACGSDLQDVDIESAGARIRVGSFDNISRDFVLRLYDLGKVIDGDIADEDDWLAAAPSSPASQPFRSPGFICCGNNVGSQYRPRSRMDIAEGFNGAIAGYGDPAVLNENGRMYFQCGRAAIIDTAEGHRRVQKFFDRLPLKPRSGQRVNAQGGADIQLMDPAFNTKIADLNLRHVSLQEAISRLQELAPVNVIIASDMPSNSEITLHVRNVTAEQALDMILAAATGGPPDIMPRYREDGIVAVSANVAAAGPLAIYDIRDLIGALMRDDNRPISALPRPWSASGTADDVARTLVTLLSEQTDAGGRFAEGTGSISVLGGRLIVEQSPVVHEQIAGYLKILRREFLEGPTNGLPLFRPDVAGRLKKIGLDTNDQAADYSNPFVDLNEGFELKGVPITEALRQINRQSNAQFDYVAGELADADIDLNAPIELSVSGVSVREVIRILFDAVSRPGTVTVNPTQVFRRIFNVRVGAGAPLRIYDVRDLVRAPHSDAADADPPESDVKEFEAADTLQKGIEERINDASSWRKEGGTGTVTYFSGRLFINQTLRNHEMIAELLTDIRKHQASQLKGRSN